MNRNEQRGPWESTPGLIQRLIALHGDPAIWSASEIADKLSMEFGLRPRLTRNSIIGKCHRLNLSRIERPMGKRKSPQTRQKMVKIRPRVDAPIPPPADRRPQTGLTIYQLRYGDCRWILQPPESYPPYTYCGAEAVEGRSYCPTHHERTHGRGIVTE